MVNKLGFNGQSKTRELTRITFIIDDKFVMKAQRLLQAFSVMDLSATPLQNTQVNGNTVEAASDGSLVGLMTAWLKRNHLQVVNAADIRRFQADMGRSASGYSNALTKAQEAGLLKHITATGKGSKAGYRVNSRMLEG